MKTQPMANLMHDDATAPTRHARLFRSSVMKIQHDDSENDRDQHQNKIDIKIDT